MDNYQRISCNNITVPGGCSFCYFNDDDISPEQCLDCETTDNLIKIKHWINDSLVSRYVCERCIIDAAVHPCLTIINS